LSRLFPPSVTVVCFTPGWFAPSQASSTAAFSFAGASPGARKPNTVMSRAPVSSPDWAIWMSSSLAPRLVSRAASARDVGLTVRASVPV
jgi:hypothetical protein